MAGVVSWFYVLAHDSRVVAEAANRAKSRYVTGLSHELRTPLNAVLGYVQLLERDETIPAPRHQAIKAIRRSAEHLSGLIDGLLDISKIEAGKLQVYSNEINIHDFLDQIVDMFRPQALAKGLAFEHSRAPSLPRHVRTDEKRLRQILINLISNALKFTDSGRIRFDVAYRSQVATITIADTGRGISQKDLPRIFDPFQRGEAEHQGRMPGLGLGLTITRLLTQTLGGEIAVASTKGEGTIFTVRLMLSEVSRPQGPMEPSRRIRGYEGPRRRIMVVDDNEDHRKLMRETLAPLGFDVIAIERGGECLSQIETARPDLFLVDISMPGMSGWELVEQLRQARQTAPIVMLSANVGDGSRQHTESGHDDTLAKPFDLGQLYDKLAFHLGLQWRVAGDAGQAEKPEATHRIALPASAHVAELIRLGEIGYIRGIEAKLTEIDAASHPPRQCRDGNG